VGMETIEARNRSLTDTLLAGCQDAGFSLTVAKDPEHRSAIVMVQHSDPPGAVAHLAGAGVIVDHRPGHIRVSPHFYNTPDEISHFLDTLRTFPG
jgi:selenocysteine lyase/cysteine desulfurase